MRSGSAWVSCGTSYMIRAAIRWMVSSFLRWVLAAEVNNELQYSKWDLMIAVYDSLSNCLGRYGVARASVPRSPWHLLTILSIWGPKVKCWSRVTPSNLTVFWGLTVQLSKSKWKSSGIFLPFGLKTISWVLPELTTNSYVIHRSLGRYWNWQ